MERVKIKLCKIERSPFYYLKTRYLLKGGGNIKNKKVVKISTVEFVNKKG